MTVGWLRSPPRRSRIIDRDFRDDIGIIPFFHRSPSPFSVCNMAKADDLNWSIDFNHYPLNIALGHHTDAVVPPALESSTLLFPLPLLLLYTVERNFQM